VSVVIAPHKLHIVFKLSHSVVSPLKARVFCTRRCAIYPRRHMTSHTYFTSIVLVQTYTYRPRVMLRERHVSGAASSGVKCASDGVTLCVFAQGGDTYHAGFLFFFR
jgi:hypothetical protein